ncbi:MAG: hypothetical protein GXY87_00445, partial [Tissierellia bacterium]|nr:hypothetical protein [Tissierellia bacterium]
MKKLLVMILVALLVLTACGADGGKTAEQPKTTEEQPTVKEETPTKTPAESPAETPTETPAET